MFEPLINGMDVNFFTWLHAVWRTPWTREYASHARDLQADRIRISNSSYYSKYKIIIENRSQKWASPYLIYNDL